MASTLRSHQRADRRRQREAQKRFREFERQAKEQAKLSALAQARFEVERYENQLEVLLSVHKEQGETWNWAELAAALPPPPPRNLRCHTWAADRQAALDIVLNRNSSETAVQARAKD